MSLEEKDAGESRARFVASIERFAGLLVDRLNQTPSGKLMDEKETRMFSSVVMRSFKIWEKALSSQNQEEMSREKLRRLKKKTSNEAEKEDSMDSGTA